MGYFTSLYSSELPHRAVTVYMYLRDRCDKDGKCSAAIGTIAAELKPSRSTVKRAIADLIRCGGSGSGGGENGGKSSCMYYVL